MRTQSATALAAAGPALIAEAVRAFGAIRLRARGGSMAPSIVDADILLVARCDSHDVQVGDVVLFARGGSLVAHRLIDIDAGSAGPVLITRGDALWSADAPVTAADLVGRIVAVGRGGVFRAPAGCSGLARMRGLAASECTALRLRIQR